MCQLNLSLHVLVVMNEERTASEQLLQLCCVNMILHVLIKIYFASPVPSIHH